VVIRSAFWQLALAAPSPMEILKTLAPPWKIQSSPPARSTVV
jgi:hypothetical protein